MRDTPLLCMAAAGTAVYASVTWVSEADGLEGRGPFLVVAWIALVGIMLAAWRRARRRPGGAAIVLVGALAFRLVAATGPPALSDDVYRYVWDGRVQLHGVHPYRYAPDHPALGELRDVEWSRINHPEVPTIYPPLAQAFFAGLAALGLRSGGFKVAMALADFAVVLALAGFLRRQSLPPDRLVLYAWHPLAVMETAGSGHVEPLGVLFLVLGAGWIVDRRRILSTVALGAAFHVKLVPAIFFPAFLRRAGVPGAVALAAVVIALAMPYALTGPALGGGLATYTATWEANSTVYAGLEGLLSVLWPTDALRGALDGARSGIGGPEALWHWLYRHIWPRELSRLLTGLAALVWIVAVTLRGPRTVHRELLWVVAGVLVLSPTVHPWYLLWLLPWAAAAASWPALVLTVTVVLAYVGGQPVPWALRAAEYLPPVACLAVLTYRRGRSRTDPRARQGPVAARPDRLP